MAHKCCRKCNFLLDEEMKSNFAMEFCGMKRQAMFPYFAGWCHWPHRKPSKVLPYYDENGELLPERKYRFPRNLVIRMDIFNQELKMCPFQLAHLCMRNVDYIYSLIADVYKFREVNKKNPFFPRLSASKSGGDNQASKLVHVVKKDLEQNYILTGSHYEDRYRKSNTIFLKSKNGNYIEHYSVVYWDMIKRLQPDAWKCELNRRKNSKLKRHNPNILEVDLLDESIKPKPCIQHWYYMVKQILKIKINEPIKDRCPISSAIRSIISSTNDKKLKEFYTDLLCTHKRMQQDQRAFIRSHKKAVKPYKPELVKKKWFG